MEDSMRKVTYGGACSLDGFIAGANGSVDWLHFSPEVGDIMTSYFKDVDTMVMGRKTWEVALAQAGGGNGGGGGDAGGITTYVFSRTLSRIDAPGVHLVRDDPGAFVRDLKRGKGKDICVMGGGELAQSLFMSDVIDEVGFNVHPILLGSGVPAFHDNGGRIKLELTQCRQIPGGCVFMMYRVKHARGQRARPKAEM
jgi:dihydrofolate reductase